MPAFYGSQGSHLANGDRILSLPFQDCREGRNGGKAEPGFKPKWFVQKKDNFLPLLPWEQAVGGGGCGAPLTQPGRWRGSKEGGRHRAEVRGWEVLEG